LESPICAFNSGKELQDKVQAQFWMADTQKQVRTGPFLDRSQRESNLAEPFQLTLARATCGLDAKIAATSRMGLARTGPAWASACPSRSGPAAWREFFKPSSPHLAPRLQFWTLPPERFAGPWLR